MVADKPLNMPANLLRSCEIVLISSSGDKELISISENRSLRLFFQLPENTARIEITKLVSWGGKAVNTFACDII